jgi:hypothetical protein
VALSLLTKRLQVTYNAAKADVCFGARCGHIRERWHRWVLTAVLSGFLYVASLARTKAEDRLDYRYSDYAEEGGRIHVTTQGAYFAAALNSWADLKGNFVYDVISGATPTGQPYLPGTNAVNTAKMHDKRLAGFFEPTFKFSNQTLSPQFSYSQESDYRSIGIALNGTADFNEKNTTWLWGVSHSFDVIQPNEGELYYKTDAPFKTEVSKDDTSAMLGATQLLGPATTLTANATLGYAAGDLSDPYKRVLFDGFPYNPGPDPANPQPYTVFPERRPEHKFRQIAYFSLQHNFEMLHGAAELTYRFYHDDFHVTAHTASIQWNQKVGKYVTISPLFRFYTQNAAYFYGTHFPGDPSNPGSPIPLPNYYSSDYRLSELNTCTYGISLEALVWKHLSLSLAYQRYEMYGRDGITTPAQYPKANVITGGATLWF